MDPPIDPGDHTVSELEDALEEVEDPEALDAILEAERSGENRTTALEAIEERLETVEAAITEDRDAIQAIDTADDEDVLTLAGPDEDRELSERFLTNLSGIRSTLEDARRAGGQYEARLRKLEEDVGELVAYTDALEAFLDEEGTAEQLLDSVQDDIASLEDDIYDIRPVVRSHAQTLRDHRVAISDIENTVDNQASDLNEVVDSVESLEARFESYRDESAETHEDLASRLAGAEASVGEQGERIDEVAAAVESAEDTIDDVASDVQELERTVDDRLAEAADERAETADQARTNTESIQENATKIDNLTEDVENLERRIGDTDRLDDRFQQIESEIEELQAWRNQLGSVLGGGGSTSEDD